VVFRVIGYCVPNTPNLASYRLRVAIPAEHLTVPYAIGVTGAPTFFYKNGNARLAEVLTGGVVYDVVNDHFTGKWAREYHAMCSVADAITTASDVMAATVKSHTGRDAVVIPDPYETECRPASCEGAGVLWFGHVANVKSLIPYLDRIPVTVCSNFATAHVQWSLDNEARCLRGAAVVLMTGSNPGASANRVVKAIRAGRFVVAPDDCPEAWRELADYMWIGDAVEGVRWALNNREEACKRITAGQKYTQERFTPSLIAKQWQDVFASI